MLAVKPYHVIKATLYDGFYNVVTPVPGGPVAEVVKGHFSLHHAQARTLYVYFAGADENPASADELLMPGTWLFGVAAVSPKIPESYMGEGQLEAEESASLAFSEFVRLWTENPDFGLSGISSVTLQAVRASDADEYGTPFADVENTELWVEGGTFRVTLL